jgi:uncharacterized protein YhaN
MFGGGPPLHLIDALFDRHREWEQNQSRARLQREYEALQEWASIGEEYCCATPMDLAGKIDSLKEQLHQTEAQRDAALAKVQEIKGRTEATYAALTDICHAAESALGQSPSQYREPIEVRDMIKEVCRLLEKHRETVKNQRAELARMHEERDTDHAAIVQSLCQRYEQARERVENVAAVIDKSPWGDCYSECTDRLRGAFVMQEVDETPPVDQPAVMTVEEMADWMDRVAAIETWANGVDESARFTKQCGLKTLSFKPLERIVSENGRCPCCSEDD